MRIVKTSKESLQESALSGRIQGLGALIGTAPQHSRVGDLRDPRRCLYKGLF